MAWASSADVTVVKARFGAGYRLTCARQDLMGRVWLHVGLAVLGCCSSYCYPATVLVVLIVQVAVAAAALAAPAAPPAAAVVVAVATVVVVVLVMVGGGVGGWSSCMSSRAAA